MAANLCIDIGNSRIKLAILENDEVIHFRIFEHGMDAEIKAWLENAKFERGIYSTVLKTVSDWIITLSQKFNIIKLSKDLKIPLTIQYKSPESLGADRIAAMVGAMGIYSDNNILVVNAGTCITYDLVNENQEFVGGNIAPGLEMRWKAMHEYTDSLPLVQIIDRPSGFLGSDTLTALQNGGLQGVILEIEGYFGSLKHIYSDLKCILTGGSAPFLVNHLKIDNFAEPYLVLKGLNTILKYQ